jgi:tRNA pseudouridine32 synthase/23S rRNA pseudouridine746 synthase
MREHPESELHQQGKMFGVLVYTSNQTSPITHQTSYLSAFSAKLDGSYYHDGFVPPVYDMPTPPVGSSKAESQRLQRLLFAQYNFLNGRGETRNLLDIFASENPILPKEEFFNKSSIINHKPSIGEAMPPSGAGECCAPKLLQYAFRHGLQPVALAEFWIGAPSKTEVRTEGSFYTPCSGKCVPILRHMLQGLEIEPAPETRHAEALCQQIETLYEDDYLIVVNKPSGLLSVPGKSDELSVESSFQLSPFNFQYIKPVHRLDQDTSGLLVLAKTPEIYKTLQAYFQRRDILKRYEAVLRPNHKSSVINHKLEGEISLPLLPNPYDRPRQMVDFEHGKPAITRYKIREYRPDGTVLVDFFPLTGRTHQLRVHAAHPDGLNAPILYDRLYGQIAHNTSHITHNTSNIAHRLMLHAAEITFPHPVTQQQMHFCISSGF